MTPGSLSVATSRGPPAGGHVRFEVVAGSSVSARGSPGGAGTVWAHLGAGFCIGTACFGSVPCAGSAGGSLLAQSGSDSFCMGSAGSGSASGAVSTTSCVPLSLTGGATGTVLAHTGVVSWVGTAGAGSSTGGVESCESPDFDSKSMVSLSPRYRVVCQVLNQIGAPCARVRMMRPARARRRIRCSARPRRPGRAAAPPSRRRPRPPCRTLPGSSSPHRRRSSGGR
jgi:hypothetical protein